MIEKQITRKLHEGELYKSSPCNKKILPFYFSDGLTDLFSNEIDDNLKSLKIKMMSTFPELKIKINPKELKPYFITKPHLHVLAMLYDWAVIFATIYIYFLFPNILLYILAVIIIGARMHALAILMHDATHYRFLKNKKWNDLITNYLTMYPIFTSIEKYRKNHLAHHRDLNTEHDPDWVAKLGNRAFQFPKTKTEFLLTVSSYLLLYQGVMDAIWFIKRFSTKDKQTIEPTTRKMGKILFYLCLFSALILFGLWKIYLLFWVVPYFSTFFMFQYIRSVAEHFGELAYDDLLTSSRTVKPSFVERFFIAPHNVGYHLEHHLFPAVPFYHLVDLHETLMKHNDYKHKAHVTQGYAYGLLQELGKVT